MSVANKYLIERKYIQKGKARSGTKLTKGKPTFCVSHETANNNADAMAHFKYFNNQQPSASAHTFIDATRILEIVPLDEKAWHVRYNQDRKVLGKGAANDNAIGIELCRTGNFKDAYDRYVWYHAYLCRKYGWNPKEDIVSHKTLDPTRRSDPDSWLNPNGVTWTQFISDVKKYYDAWDGEVTVEARKTEVKTEVVKTPSKPNNSSSILRKNDKGAAVTNLQKKLIAAGFTFPKYGADGHYGDETVAAVKAFQKAVGIVVDGIAGPVTLSKLDTYKKPSSTKEAVVPYPGKLIKRGSKGKDVERIQRAVGVNPDGDFGAKTEASVKNYQKRHGLKVDGIVGKDTWNMMF